MDKKEYQAVIEACTSLAAISTIQNKLNKVLVTTEDPKLEELLSIVVGQLNLAHISAVAVKKSSVKTKLVASQEPHKSLLAYCAQQLKSAKPQWQLIAEQHGWAPKNG